jgi:hypothetical protein
VGRFLKEQGLALFFLGLMLLALAGLAVAGHAEYNDEAIAHARLMHEQPETISLWRYLISSDYGNAVMENWQSEYLQFTLFIVATVWFVERGSPESKELGKPGTESDSDQMVGEEAAPSSPVSARTGGLRTFVYSNSLLIVMGLIFIGSWTAQSLTGWSVFNADQRQHGLEPVSWLSYVGSASFWESTLENWQSEFLAVGSMVVLAIFLRQRGSPESKPVGASHDATGIEG